MGRNVVGEGARRLIFVALLAVAVCGALGLMTSGLVVDPEWRLLVQVVAAVMALGFGTVCGVLAWRWWGAYWRENQRPHP